VGFEPTISAGERPQSFVLDGAATGTYLPQPPELLFSYLSTSRRYEGDFKVQRAFLNKVFLRSLDYACSVRNMGKSVDNAGLLRTVWKKADMACFMVRHFSLHISWKRRFY